MPNMLQRLGARIFGRATPAGHTGPLSLRRFEAAAVNRLTESWLATQASIDTELRGDLDRLRRRSRDLAKNNEYMAKFLRMVRNNVVGQRMTLQSRPMDGAKLDGLAAAAIERHWAEWCRPQNCDIAGRQGFWTLMRNVVDAIARDGEPLLRLRPGSGPYGLQLQLLDIERLDTTYNVAKSGNSNAIIMGVEVDENHRPLFYHLLRQMPGSTYGERRGERERVPAAQIIHVYIGTEPEQTRGVPWAHAAMRRLNDLGGYREAAVIAARIGASKMGFFTSPEPDQVPQDGKDAQGIPYTNATPGEFGVLPAGVSFTEYNPAYPHEQFADFTKAALRGIASGLGVSYNSLANDLEGVNFSSIRSGVLEERDEWMVLQDWFIEQVLDPIFDTWLRMALASGALTQAGTKGSSALPMAKREKFAQHIWMPRRWGWVDPLKDVQATVLAIQNNLETLTDANARNGVDIEDVFATRQRERELAAQYGIDLTPAAAPSKPSIANGQAEDDPEDDTQDDPQDAAQQAARGRRQAVNLAQDEMQTLTNMAQRAQRAGQTIEMALRVEAPPVPAAPPVVNVAAPVVNVAPAQVTVINDVQPTAVQVQVEAPNVAVEAVMPAPNVSLQMPARRSETEIRRDQQGRIEHSSTIEYDVQ